MLVHVIYILLYFASTSALLSGVQWTQDALRQYHRFCGESQMCDDTKSQLNITDSVPTVCPKCDCTIECRRRGNCCPEILLTFPNRTCENIEILKQTPGPSNPIEAGFKYEIVQDCPETSPDQLNKKCISNRNVTSQMTSLPVTSLSTLVTYKNIYCLKCNENNVTAKTWKLDISCLSNTDFNFLNSLDEIHQVAKKQSCGIFSVPDSFAERCEKTPGVLIHSCNITGTLIHENEAIEKACLLIDQPYGMFRNLFCYMCNPPVGQMDVIRSCPNDNTDFARLCRQYPLDQSTFPYKNYYCFICNNNSNKPTVDLIYDMNTTGNGFTYHVFTDHCKPGMKSGAYQTNDKSATPPFYRPWDYVINCPNMNIFSLFYDTEQIKKEAVVVGCNISSSALNMTLSCFQKQDLIRQCNNTGQMLDFNPILETACLSIENDHLLAYKGYYNIFCYMCNVHLDRQNICYNEGFLFLINMDTNLRRCDNISEHDLTIEWVICSFCVRPGYGGSSNGYRQIFMLSSYKETISSEKYLSCRDNQIYDTSIQRCRDLYCGPGKMLTNRTCTPIIQVTSRLSYIFAARFDAFITKPNTNQSGTNPLKDIYNELWTQIENKIEALFQIMRGYILANVYCQDVKQKQFGGLLSFQLFVPNDVERIKIEERLIGLLRSSFKIDLDNTSLEIRLQIDDEALKTPYLVDKNIFSDQCYLKEINAIEKSIEKIKPSIVNDLLLCQQIELSTPEFMHDNYQQIKISANGFILGPNDYLLIEDGKVRICVEKYKDVISKPAKKNSIDLSIYILSTICTTISFVCLIITFFTYSVFKVLRTIPGKNNMTLVIALLFNSVCIQVRFQDIDQEGICQLFGIISHYFLLSVFTSFNICTFHVYRVFTNTVSHFTKSNSLCLKYNAYAFGIPALIVISNIVVTYIVEDNQTIGYGGDYCFLILKNGAITTILCPIGMILIANTFMFIAAARHIYMSPHVSSENTTRDKRKDVVIYLKLFTITGCTWIFQFIDAFFPESIFTVFVSLCNMLTGVYIFTSYICNKRVWMLYNTKFLRYSSIEESEQHTKSDRYSHKSTSSNLYQHSHLQTEVNSNNFRDTRL